MPEERPRSAPLFLLMAVAATSLPAGSALAHSFGQVYTLPVPVSLYLYSSAAALVLSFLVVGLFVTARSLQLNRRTRDISAAAPLRWLTHPATLTAARVLSVAGLTLTLATGLLGTNNAYRNFSMTYFWILFVLGYTYLTALIGNTYAVLNPWQTLCEWLERLRPGLFTGMVAYPRRLAYWPALILYIAFIWFELFGASRPFPTALALGGYSLLNLTAAYVFGRHAWFRYGEFFAVLLHIIGLMAPLSGRRDERSDRPAILLRQPMVGLTMERVSHFSLLVFVLFMLSSTAFDGIKSTVPYVRIYWVHVVGWLQPWVGSDIVQSFPRLKAIYAWWQVGVLILSPFLYLAVYLLFIALTKWISRCELGIRELALRFAYSLVPIAFVYHITHYYTLLLSQGTQVVRLISDPFGYGWDLFGTADSNWKIIVEAGAIWHTQVWLILVGHIISVYLAHLEALEIFGNNRRAALSQLPMLLLMVALTTAGLWILSLPISR